MKRFTVFAAMAIALLSAADAQAENHYYLVDEMAKQSSHADVRAQAHELEAIYADMGHQSGVDAKLIYSTDPDINAFATEIDDEKFVVVQEGLLENMKGDREAVAAVLGHELAHHKADHIRAGRRKQEGVRIFGAILGAVVGAKVGRSGGVLAGAAAGTAVGVGANLIALKFNRNQEMEADRLSVGWMIAAGYNPQGMLRLQRQLSELEKGHRKSAIFSTHPTSAKRYQTAEKLIAKLNPPPELLAHEVLPLVGDKQLADSRAEIKGVEDARIAEVLKPKGEAPSSAALAPVNGLAFDSYAALSNELVYAGDKGKARVLASHHLTDAKLTQAKSSFATRMQQSESLSARYSVSYFRASQGKLAAYGRDLADSYETGKPLQLDPPYPLETAAEIFAAMQARGAPNFTPAQEAAAEKDILKPHGLSYYDFLIGHNWWTRQATIAALTGDESVMNTYFAAVRASTGIDDTASSAGVQIGSNVHIGKNVRIGGKEAQPSDASANQPEDE
jgi:Zn-dependent protease with chaperone function